MRPFFLGALESAFKLRLPPRHVSRQSSCSYCTCVETRFPWKDILCGCRDTRLAKVSLSSPPAQCQTPSAGDCQCKDCSDRKRKNRTREKPRQTQDQPSRRTLSQGPAAR